MLLRLCAEWEWVLITIVGFLTLLSFLLLTILVQAVVLFFVIACTQPSEWLVSVICDLTVSLLFAFCVVNASIL